MDGNTLITRYAFIWGRETRNGHGAPAVLPEGAKVPSDSYRIFYAYFLCGLSSPFSDFFCAMMTMYGLHLLDFTPNAMACMVIFTHPCKNFVGVAPNVDMFRHVFIPRIEY